MPEKSRPSARKPVTIAAGLLAGVYLLGGFSASRDIWPWPLLRSFKAKLQAAPAFGLDRFGRLERKPGALVAPCPKQADDVAVMLVLGQSNSANHGGQRGSSQFGDRIVNHAGGECYRAVSPLLGSTGRLGEHWTATANLLVQAGRFQSVVIAPVAVGNSSVRRWSRYGDLNRAIRETIDALREDGLAVSHVLWTQGEADASDGMSEAAYRTEFISLAETLREAGVDAPIYVAVSTYCAEAPEWREDNGVARALRALPGVAENVRPGVDADRLLTETDRYDGCHLGGTGAAKISEAWAGILTGRASNRP